MLPRVPGTPLLDLPRAARRPFAAQLRAFADVVHSLDPGVEVPVDDVAPEQWRAEAQDTWAAVGDEVPASPRDRPSRPS